MLGYIRNFIKNEINFSLKHRYTKKNKTVYAAFLNWPQSGTITLTAPVTNDSTKVNLLGYEEDLKVGGNLL